MKKNRKKILFVIGDIGGGHLSTSRAIESAIERRYPGKFEMKIVDIFVKSDPMLDWSLKEGYSLSSNKFISIYATLYYLTDIPFIIGFQSKMQGVKVVRGMVKLIKEEKPDLIVSVHPFTTYPAAEARMKIKDKTPIITVVSDPYTGHSSWYFDKRADLFILLSRMAAVRAKMDGIPEEKIFVTQTPIDPKFNSPLPENEIEKFAEEIKVDRKKLTILMAGGGEGLRGSIPIIRELNKFKEKPNILVVCGRNKSMFREISNIQRKHPNVKAFGFVNFMYELMNLSDIIILKAGPATIKEALQLRKPLILNSYVWGQERGNVNFCVNNKIGFYITSPKDVAKKIIEIEQNPQILKELKSNIDNINLYNGSDEIARKIYEYL